MKELVKKWFEKWEEGDFENIPVELDFVHTSPFGTIEGRNAYLKMVSANKDGFLGHRFEIHDELYYEDRACVRYTSHKEGFELDVSEWFYRGDTKIKEIVSYYNVGKVSYEASFNNPDT